MQNVLTFIFIIDKIKPREGEKMQKVTKINHSNIQEIRLEIQKKLDELKILGLNISLGNIRFDDDSFRTQMNVRVEGAEPLYVKEFKKSTDFFNHPNAIGKVVDFDGGKFEFLGFKPRARKNKALIKDLRNGKEFVTKFYFIKRQLTDEVLKDRYPEEYI